MRDDWNITDEQRVAVGLRPRTVKGWWCWLWYWSPFSRLLKVLLLALGLALWAYTLYRLSLQAQP